MPFKYLNTNPLGVEEEDCVCRAIMLALDMPYKLVEHKLNLIAELFECDELCVCCYQHLLEDVYGLERVPNVRGLTVEEFAYYFNEGTYIIRLDGHLTCLIDGINYDLWDTSKQVIDVVWRV